MTDMREKQPEKKTFDWTHRTKGNAVYKIRLWCPVYHGIKNEDVYPKKPTYLIRSLDFETATADAYQVFASRA